MSIINRLYFRFRNFFSTRFPRAYHYCEGRKSFFKFTIVGFFSGAVDLLFLFLLHGLANLDIVLATSLSFILSFLFSFTFQKFWTFRNYEHERVVRQLALYLSAAFLYLNLNGLFMHILVNGYHIWYLLAQLLVNFLIGLLNFLAYKFIIFRHHKKTCV